MENIEIEIYDESCSNLNALADKIGFRSFSLELEPKLILSKSMATKELLNI